MEEIEVKEKRDQLSKASDEPINNESSVDLIVQTRKANILSLLNDKKVKEKPIKIPFKKIETQDKEEALSKSKIVYPTNLYSSLSFNWLYNVIKKKNRRKSCQIIIFRRNFSRSSIKTFF